MGNPAGIVLAALIAASGSAIAEGKPDKKSPQKPVSTSRGKEAAKAPTCPPGQFYNGHKCEDNRDRK